MSEKTNENLASTIALDKTLSYPPYPDQKDINTLAGTRAIKEPPRADVNLNIPYVHQLWDTPEEFNGNWACGPTCVTMVLAYYNALEANPIEISTPRLHTSPFGVLISRGFSYNASCTQKTPLLPLKTLLPKSIS